MGRYINGDLKAKIKRTEKNSPKVYKKKKSQSKAKKQPIMETKEDDVNDSN